MTKTRIAGVHIDSLPRTLHTFRHRRLPTSAGPGIGLLCLKSLRPKDRKDQTQWRHLMLRCIQGASPTVLRLEDGQKFEYRGLKPAKVRSETNSPCKRLFCRRIGAVARCTRRF